jgi:hypothetical protein
MRTTNALRADFGTARRARQSRVFGGYSVPERTPSSIRMVRKHFISAVIGLKNRRPLMSIHRASNPIVGAPNFLDGPARMKNR